MNSNINTAEINIGGCSDNIEIMARQAGLDGVVVTRDSEGRFQRDYEATVEMIANNYAHSERLESLFYNSPETTAIFGEVAGKRGSLYDCVDLLEMWADGKVIARHFDDADCAVASETFLYVSEATRAPLVAVLSKIEDGEEFRHHFEIATENRMKAAV